MILKPYQERINALLAKQLPNETNNRLHQAMRYSVLNGGKRLRPILVYLTGKTFDTNLISLDAPAYAIELIHCYSLIHDDLPAMDNDDLRRGKPTCHKAFDEATAILAGDALQTIAFDALADANISLLKILIHAANEIIEGQMLDIQWMTQQEITVEQLLKIYSLKTGALIKAAVQLGAITSTCEKQQFEALSHYAENLGLAFQIQDDILDIESNTETLGKNIGADAILHKSTYPVLTSVEKARSKVKALIEEAHQLLDSIQLEESLLAMFLNKIMERKY